MKIYNLKWSRPVCVPSAEPALQHVLKALSIMVMGNRFGQHYGKKSAPGVINVITLATWRGGK